MLLENLFAKTILQVTNGRTSSTRRRYVDPFSATRSAHPLRATISNGLQPVWHELDRAGESNDRSN